MSDVLSDDITRGLEMITNQENKLGVSASGSNELLYACRISDVAEAWIESLHKTKEGAYFAGRKWMVNEHNSSFQSRELIGKNRHDFRVRHHFNIVKMIVSN